MIHRRGAESAEENFCFAQSGDGDWPKEAQQANRDSCRMITGNFRGIFLPGAVSRQAKNLSLRALCASAVQSLFIS